jgi:hypothetical protein
MRLLLLYEVGRSRLRMGYEGRRCDLYGALPGKTGVQDVMRSHPTLKNAWFQASAGFRVAVQTKEPGLRT